MSLQFVRDSLYEHQRQYGQMPTKLGLKVTMWMTVLREVFSNMPCSPATPPLVPTMIMGVDVFPVNDNGVYLTQEQALQEWVTSTATPGFNPVYSLGTLVTVDIGPYRYAVAPMPRYSYTAPSIDDRLAAAERKIKQMAVDEINKVGDVEPPCHCRSASEHEVGCEYIKWKRSRVC